MNRCPTSLPILSALALCIFSALLLSDHLLFGGSFGWTLGNLQFERSGGSAYSQAPPWNAYLSRSRDNGSYLTGEFGHSRQQLRLERLNLGAGDQHLLVASEQTLSVGMELELR